HLAAHPDGREPSLEDALRELGQGRDSDRGARIGAGDRIARGCKVEAPLLRGAHAARRSANLLAAVSVLSISIAIVIGPTPPGTGVRSDATSRTESKSTSPTRR